MGQDTAASAARSLRLLNSADMRHHPQIGPQVRRTAPTTPGTPLNLGIVDYIAQAVHEIDEHAHTVAPDAGPLPPRVEDIYAWYVETTTGADEAEQRYRDIVIERQRLEHAVRLGDTDEVCSHPCPRCGTWGLMWKAQRAQCTNLRCRTPEGMSSTWSLGRLAAQKVQRTEIWRRSAT